VLNKGIEMVEKEGIKNGFIAGLLGTLCCTLPLAIIALAVFFGIGTATLGLYIGFYGELFIVIALIFLAISTYFYLKKKNCCNLEGVKRYWKTIALSLLIMLAVYWLIKFAIVPFLAKTMFGG
jgi:hypothetical protein